MIAIVLLLVGITIGFAYPTGVIETSFYDFRLTAIGVPAITVLYALLGAAIARAFAPRLSPHAPAPRAAFASFLRWMVLYRALLLAGYATQVFGLLWPSFVDYEIGLAGVPLAEKLAVLLPLLLSLFLSWIPLYRIDRVLRGSDWPMRSYLAFQSRFVFGPVLAAFLVLAGIEDGVRLLPWLARALGRYASLELLLVVASLTILFVLSPLLLRFVWGVRPLPPGPLRDRLAALCGRARLRVRDFLVWETRGGRFANALVAGIVPWIRYVFFTRTLLDRLTEDELEAVLAHEMGHARHRHLLWYFGLGVGLTLLVTSLVLLLNAGPILAQGLAFALLGGYWSFLLLYASRRFEGQADLFSLRTVGVAAPLASALLKVAALNGVPPEAKSVTHGSILERVGFLSAVEQEPRLAEPLERRVAAVQFSIGGVLVVGLVAALAAACVEVVTPHPPSAESRAQDLTAEADRLSKEGRLAEAERALREAVILLPKHPYTHLNLAECLERRGKLEETRTEAEQALSLGIPDPVLRERTRFAMRELEENIKSGKGIEDGEK